MSALNLTPPAYLKLTRNERAILQFRAIYQTKYVNLDTAFAHHLKLTKPEYYKIANSLIKQKLIVNRSWTGAPYIPDPICLSIFINMMEEEKDLMQTMEEFIVQHDEPVSNLYSYIRYAICGGKLPKNRITEADIRELFYEYLDRPWIKNIIELFDDTQYYSFVDNILYQYTLYGRLLPRETLDMMLDHKTNHPLVHIKTKDVVDLYRYVAYGDFVDDKPSTGQPMQMVRHAIRMANLGDYEGAHKLFKKSLTALNKEYSVKNAFMDLFPEFYRITSLMHLEGEEANKKIQQTANKKETSSHHSLGISSLLAKAVLSERNQIDKTNLKRILKAEAWGIVATNVRYIGCLIDKHYNVGLNEAKAVISTKPAFAILRHELSEYLDLSDDERQSLKQMYGDRPILSSIHLKQPWEYTIENIMNTVKETVGEDDSVKPKARLMYVVSGDSIIPQYQTILKSGKWSVIKDVNFDKFREGEIPGMDDNDRRIARAIPEYTSTWSYYYPRYAPDYSYHIMAPLLVGSDKVYYLSGGEPKHTSIETQEAYLSLTPLMDGSFIVGSNISTADLMTRDGNTITIKKGSHEFTVIKLTDAQIKILERMLGELRFPAESEPMLRRLLSQVDRVLEVRSPLFDKKAIENVNGGDMLCVQVMPSSGMFYSICVMAHPVPDTQTLKSPGEGTKSYYDSITTDGTTRTIRVKRDLQAEKEALHTLADILDDDSSEPIPDLGAPSVAIDIDRMLLLLDYARNNPDKIAVDWQQGKQIKLRESLSKSKWNVGLKANNGWFDIEGNISIDQDTVLTMSQLLELVEQSKGRFVRLSENDFVEIDSKLRRQLERLGGMAVRNRNKLQISQFGAASLDDSVINGEVKIGFDNKLKQLRSRIADSLHLQPEIPAALNATLRPYQVDGFQWMSRLASWGAGACLADDMGLGKTVQTIAFMLTKCTEGPSLIVAPASVVPNWVKEISRFAPSLKVTVLNKADDRTKTINDAAPYDVVISTYGLLNTEETALADKKWTCICLDEAHIIKNRDTKMSQAAMKLQGEYRIILTGTPIQNHLGELWNLFRFINPGLLGSYEAFNRKFVGPIINDHNKDRQRTLQKMLRPFMLRRTKNDVIDDLPEKNEIVLDVELSNDEMAMYEAMRLKAVADLEKTEKLDVNTLSEITKLRRAACSMQLVDDKWDKTDSKIQAFLNLVEGFKGNNNRMLVFSQFTSMLALVRKALDDAGEPYLYLDGSTTMKQREKLVEEFHQGKCRIFLISLKAGGLGLNLTEANYVVHLDPWWNPAIEQQATDRAYRIGQDRNVTVYHLVAKGTIEEKIRRLHRTKRDLADSLLEGSDMASKLTVKDMLELVSAD